MLVSKVLMTTKMTFLLTYCFFIILTAFDKESNKMFLDVTQRWVSTILPRALYAPTLRSIIVFYLQRGADGRFYVKRQEDYYQPQT